MKNHLEHSFFKKIKIEELNVANFDSKLKEASSDLVGIFFWGHNCPNCEIAKDRLSEESEAMNSLGFKWFHVNTYENFELGTQFGLFGIPTFIFFHNDKKLGRISPFPGVDPFFSALNELKIKSLKGML
jgi:thiol-disulfide isomerase/thioredoxin